MLIVKPDPFQMVFEPKSATRKADIIKQWKIAKTKDIEESTNFLKMAAVKEAFAQEVLINAGAQRLAVISIPRPHR